MILIESGCFYRRKIDYIFEVGGAKAEEPLVRISAGLRQALPFSLVDFPPAPSARLLHLRVVDLKCNPLAHGLRRTSDRLQAYAHILRVE